MTAITESGLAEPIFITCSAGAVANIFIVLTGECQVRSFFGKSGGSKQGMINMYSQIINSPLSSFEEKKIMKKYLHCICTRMYCNSIAANQGFESRTFLKDREIENLWEISMMLQ